MGTIDTTENIACTPSELAELLAISFRDNDPALIVGQPGIGKSDIVDQSSRAAGMELIIAHPVVSDPTDFKGMPYVSADGRADFSPFGDLRRLIEADKPTVFFLDDLGQAPPATQAAAMQLVLARQINGVAIPDHVRFVAATNRKKDRAGVGGILEPVKGRFDIFHVRPDVDSWCTWALEAGLPIEFVALARFKPDMLTDWTATDDITNSPTPRNFARAAQGYAKGIPAHLEFKKFAARLGEGHAAEACAFIRTFRSLPNIDTVLLDPEHAPVPEDMGVLFAISAAVASRATDANFGQVAKYSDRLPVEFNVFLVSTAVKRVPEIQNTRAFAEFMARNGSVLF
jgi:hypothetical protein